ncbi:MAG: hypothetical protein GXP58_03530 [Deltaproteobacteria bacterium]|nr:hypothetical protein [Deltaproteobacteria bacterium]
MRNDKAAAKKLLREGRYPEILSRLGEKRRTVRLLRSLLYEDERIIKWRAVTMFGRLARENPELIIPEVDRLIWSLNDEAGSIGRSAPETLGEIARNNARIARDGGKVVVHYIEDTETCRPPNRNLEILVGVLWAIGRIGERRPEEVEEVLTTVESFCKDPDANVRGHALWALGRTRVAGFIESIRNCMDDAGSVIIYEDEWLRSCTVGQLAQDALRQ